MVSQNLQLLRQLIRIGGHHAAVAVTAEVLAREKAEAPQGADRAGHAPADSRAEGLGAVLYEKKAVPLADRLDLPHVRGLTEQMDRQNGLSTWGDGRLDPCGIDIEGLG